MSDRGPPMNLTDLFSTLFLAKSEILLPFFGFREDDPELDQDDEAQLSVMATSALSRMTSVKYTTLMAAAKVISTELMYKINGVEFIYGLRLIRDDYITLFPDEDRREVALFSVWNNKPVTRKKDKKKKETQDDEIIFDL